ncbi:hypothetical protein LZC95_37455 [Pendulispora brunnea]|uniref:Uncharacterized protein n=1 Tax=Pendulispora brunnea TaxID=2905690 RepID=A0ABZ2K054_9BACT
MPSRKNEAAGTARRLKDEQVFKLVFPGFDENQKALTKSPTCTGQNIFDDKVLAGGTPKGGWPIRMQEGQITQGSGGDRIKVVWLRLQEWPDGTAGGPLAIIRGSEHFAELYAVVPFRGRPDKVRLGTERMGGELLVTAEEDGCTGHQAGTPCEASLHIFLPRQGTLQRVVDVPVERIAYGSDREKGTQGKLEFHMTSASRVQPDGIHLAEQVEVKDDGGQVLRKAELDRVFKLTETGLVANEGSLWERIAKPEPEKAEKPEKTKSPPRRQR